MVIHETVSIRKEEAEKKWCPAARLILCDRDVIDNRRLNVGSTMCITDQCMKWVETSRRVVTTYHCQYCLAIIDVSIRAVQCDICLKKGRRKDVRERHAQVIEGYCGL